MCFPNILFSVKRILPIPVAAWFLLHDNSLPHRVLSVKEFLSVRQITVLSHAPYSPDLSSWFFLTIYATETGVERPSPCWRAAHSHGRGTTALHHSTKCCPGLLQRPPETLGAVYWCRRKQFRMWSLAPECKYTVHIFVPSFSELSGHGL
jgi:hypothetical protein